METTTKFTSASKINEAGPRTALVLGATGGIGSETATALARHGWTIRALSRHGAPAGDTTGWEWIKGDAMDGEAVVRAARGTQAIVHAVNPAGYSGWSKLVLPMIDNTIQAARASGARILLPGTIYNYGPDAFPVLHENSPQHATTEKGLIRIALEKRLEEAAAQGVPSLIVRFGDFFGPKTGNSWFTQGMVKPGKPVRAIMNPGKPGVGHDWAYLPDGGETFARLMDQESRLEPFARFHFRGHWDANGHAFVMAIGRAVGQPSIKVTPAPWWLFKIASLFSATMKGLYTVRELWQTPVELDNTRLVSFLGEEPHTPLDEAIATTLDGLGCR